MVLQLQTDNCIIREEEAEEEKQVRAAEVRKRDEQGEQGEDGVRTGDGRHALFLPPGPPSVAGNHLSGSPRQSTVLTLQRKHCMSRWL